MRASKSGSNLGFRLSATRSGNGGRGAQAPRHLLREINEGLRALRSRIEHHPGQSIARWSDASPLRDDVLTAVTRSVQAVVPGVRVVPSQASGATDGAIFRNVGIPTYGVNGVFMKHSDNFAHGLNERVPVQSFYDNLEIWYRLVKTMAGPASAAAKNR